MAKTIDPTILKNVISALDPANDDHWNKSGGPDMNHIKEAAGTAVSRKLMGEHGFEGLTRENVGHYQARIADQAEGPDEPEKEKQAVTGDDVGDVSEVLGDLEVADEGEGPGNEPEQASGRPYEPVIPEDPEEEAPALNLMASLETGEPTINNKELLEYLENPGTLTAEQGGAVIVKALDMCGLVMNVEVRRRQGELGEVIQLYQANRPSIIGRQKRLAQRQAQIHQAENG